MPEATPEPAAVSRAGAGLWLIALGALALAVIAGAAFLIWRVVRGRDGDSGEEETDEE